MVLVTVNAYRFTSQLTKYYLGDNLKWKMREREREKEKDRKREREIEREQD